MRVGVPKEVKPDEYRVAMMPVGAEELIAGRARGARREPTPASAAGSPTRITSRSGRRSSPTAAEVFDQADMIVKVKEPQPAEIGHVPAGADRLHLLPLRRRRGADRRRAWRAGITAIAYETIKDKQGHAAAAHADERGRRQDEHPGGGEVPREAA